MQRKIGKTSKAKNAAPVILAPVNVADTAITAPALATKSDTTQAERDAFHAKRAELVKRDRDTVQSIYAGASLATHKIAKTPIGAILAHVASPIQRIGKSGPTVRDASRAVSVAYAPDYSNVAPYLSDIGADIGAISRIASAGAFAMHHDASGAPERIAVNPLALRAIIRSGAGDSHIPVKLRDVCTAIEAPVIAKRELRRATKA